jgi:hypothetical protein
MRIIRGWEGAEKPLGVGGAIYRIARGVPGIY